MRLKVFLKDNDKKNWFQLFTELITFGFHKKEMPRYYIGKYLYHKSVSNYKDYLSLRQTDKITLSKEHHKPEISSILRSKLGFALYCEKFGLETPTLLAHNLNGNFYFGRDVFMVKDRKDLFTFFTKIFNQTNENQIFLKPIDDMGGTGCILLKKENLGSLLEIHGETIIKSNNIHQKVMAQHEAISAIYPHSVNTIRFDTYRDKNGEGHILSALFRFGAGGSYVDNASSGGFYVPVDLSNGTLRKKGFQLMRYGGKILTRHPDTLHAFEGFQIPFFEESCALILKALSYIPDGIIGWDLAISPTGPVIIEGNDNNSLFMTDIAFGGYLKHPKFKEILETA